jgi:arylsulfatase
MNRILKRKEKQCGFCFVFCVCFFVFIPAVFPERVPQRPNIIIVSTDTLRADRLGCYGYARRTSPHVDAFAKEAVLFQNAISPSPHTAPSHMSFFTGMSPTVHGVANFQADGSYRMLSERIPLLAELLHSAGYQTYGFHGGGNISDVFGFARGFDWYQKIKIDQTEARGFPTIKETLAARAKDKPVFLFVHHLFCHDPYVWVPAGFRKPFQSGLHPLLPASQDDLSSALSCDFLDMRARFWRDIDPSNAAHQKHLQAVYDGAVLYSDYLFKRLMVLLQKEKMYDDSIIVFMSDHGEEFYEHGQYRHEQLFIETLHVPMIVRFPRAEYAGTRIFERVMSFDIMPTILEYCSIPFSHQMQARSVWPFLTGKGTYEQVLFSYVRNSYRLYDDEYVYLWDNQNELLFNTTDDPREEKNIFLQKPAVAEKIKISQGAFLKASALLKEYYDSPDLKDQAFLETDSHRIDELKALGYVN